MKTYFNTHSSKAVNASTFSSQAMKRITCSLVLAMAALFLLPHTALGRTILIDKRTLEERVADADLIFVGKLINKQISEGWAKAELLVEEPIAGVKKGDKVQVTWRIAINGQLIYDAEEGLHGLVMLKNTNKHNERYWFKGVKDIKLKAGVIAARKATDKQKFIKKELEKEQEKNEKK